jgi:hypothetical protein
MTTQMAVLLSRVDGAVSENELVLLLTDLAREARSVGLRAEQLLVLLKQAIGRHAVRAGDLAERRRRERLVSLCIDAYYAR